MNSKPPGGSFDAIANESIVIVDDGKRPRPHLSSLDSAMISTSTRRLSRKPEQSLYPNVSNLPAIVTADAVWAATFRRHSEDNTISKALPSQDQQHTRAPASDITREIAANNNDEPCSSVESHSFERKTVEVTPGQFVPLRGSEETLVALDHGQVTNVTCIFCDVNLVVHAAASMIICPDCEMIAPLGVDNKDGEASLGLGLKRESLEQLSSSSHFKDGNGIFAESIVEELKTCNINRDPDEDSLSR